MLSEIEMKQLVELLKKIDNPGDGLPQPIFDEMVKIVPFVACELVFKSRDGRLLLKWRDDEWWKGWHFPGGLLRFDESFDKRIQYVAEQEVGVKVANFKFLFVENCNHAVRGHVVSLVFLCETETEPEDNKFFKDMPGDIIEGHKGLWKRVKDLA